MMRVSGKAGWKATGELKGFLRFVARLGRVES
jgi:hypothetical protein